MGDPITTALITGGTTMLSARSTRRSSDKARRQARALSGEARKLEEQWRDYMKETQEPFIKAGTRALGMQEEMLPEILGGLDYDAASRDPRFLTARDEAEDALLRRASATGGLRSGSTQAQLMEMQPQLLQRVAQDRMQDRLRGFDALGTLVGRGQGGAQTLGGAGAQSVGNIGGILGQQATLGMTSAADRSEQNMDLLRYATSPEQMDIYQKGLEGVKNLFTG